MKVFNLLIINENPTGETNHFSNIFHCTDIHKALKSIFDLKITDPISNPGASISHIELTDITKELE